MGLAVRDVRELKGRARLRRVLCLACLETKVKSLEKNEEHQINWHGSGAQARRNIYLLRENSERLAGATYTT